MNQVHISALLPEMHLEAARLLASAFVTNPLHVAAFGPGAQARNEAFFRLALASMKGPKSVALIGTRVVGVIHWTDSPGCQFSTVAKLRMTPSMIRGFGLLPALRVGTWLSRWSRHDPPQPHSHLGPIAVAPEAQGQRIGQQLMEHYCRQLDPLRRASYLETDRPENVAFATIRIRSRPTGPCAWRSQFFHVQACKISLRFRIHCQGLRVMLTPCRK
jgi:GNAT superfamily N-acetyltransferase